MPETFVSQPIPWLTVSCDPFRISDGVRHRRPDPRGHALSGAWPAVSPQRETDAPRPRADGIGGGHQPNGEQHRQPTKTLYVLRHGLNQGITVPAQLSHMLVQNMLKLIPLTSLGLLIGRRTCLDSLSLVIETFRET